MHPVLILTHNNLALTQRTVESCYKQRIAVTVSIVDNGSKDGTFEWAHDTGILLHHFQYNAGVSTGWNYGLNALLHDDGYEHVLVLGNDTIIEDWFYAALLSYDVPFVTGVAVDKRPGNEMPERMPLTPNPDFSAFLIRRNAWETVGPFDDRLVMYVQDCDMHVRAHRMGLALWKANAPFYHERSSTMNNADPDERRLIQAQADADRGRFRSMYGVVPGEAGYEKLFQEG